MGIYDREYYRREGPSILGAFTDRGKVCAALVAVNVGVYVLQLLTNSPAGPEGFGSSSIFTEFLSLDVARVLHGEIWRLLTYAFVHDPTNYMHILWNMLFLWWFGSDLEDLYGPREFLAFYLVSAVVGGVAFVLQALAGNALWATCIGASGAVTAVMVLCALHFPTRIIYLFFFLPIPIWFFVIFQVAQDTFGFLSGHAGNVAVVVHLGGAAFGFVYYKLHWRLLNIGSGLASWQKQRSRPRLRVYHEEDPSQPVPVPPGPADVDEHLEAKVDAVLEKVARYGQESLTDGERQLLLRASEVYKKRRT